MKEKKTAVAKVVAKKKEKVDQASLEYLMSCIGRWKIAVEKHNGSVEFFGSFVIFDDHNEFFDGIPVAYGVKDSIVEVVEAMAEGIANDDEEFISW